MLPVSFVQTDTNKVGCCCVHVGDGVEMDTTTPNIQQQHAAGCTNPCNIQQYWELLANNVHRPFAWGFMVQFYPSGLNYIFLCFKSINIHHQNCILF